MIEDAKTLLRRSTPMLKILSKYDLREISQIPYQTITEMYPNIPYGLFDFLFTVSFKNEALQIDTHDTSITEICL